jgi:hypothetical protein
MGLITKIINHFFTDKKKAIDELNLSTPVNLEFNKDEYGNYKISFYHPVYKTWWTLPEGSNAAIHARWSFHNHGSFGAYGLHKLTCKYSEIDSFKAMFKTLNDIQVYFDKMNKHYDSFQEYQKRKNELPSTVR